MQKAMFKVLLATALAASLSLHPSFGQSIEVKCDKPDGIYAVGDTVRWNIRTKGPLEEIKYTLQSNMGKATQGGSLSGETVEYRFDRPGTAYLKVTGKKPDGKEASASGGAVAGVDQIKPSAEKPADFDSFWAEKISQLRALPMDAELKTVDSGNPAVKYDRFVLSNLNEAKVRGQVARPVKEGKYPAVLQLQWAGVYPLQKEWVLGLASGGWLSMNISAHDLPIDEPAAFYSTQAAGALKNYPAIGNDDRETSYFLRMYLSCVRAVDYLKTQPDWDGKTLVVMGGSQGGMLALVTAGLCPDVTAAIADVPAGCDMLGPTVGRRGGWPQWYDMIRGVDYKTPHDPVKVREASQYFDVVNFAPNIRCSVLIGAGLLDDLCPAAGIIAAFNQMPSTHKKLLLMPDAPHQNERNSHAPLEQAQWKIWMPSLQKGKKPPLTTAVN